ncbi:MAG: response regulator, partial [Bryobacteraceae bacterium]
MDDDVAICQLLEALLAADGRHVETTCDSREALRRIEAADYDLVVTDVRMPGMNGLELLRGIREVRPETRVVVMTADNTPANIIESIR